MFSTIEKLKFLLSNIFQFFFPTLYKNRILSHFKVEFQKNTIDQEFEILPYLLSNQSFILDIGANNGEYCFFFQEVIRAKSIVAFEPIPRLYQRLKVIFSNIQIYPYAISSQSINTILQIPYIQNRKTETRAKLDDLKEIGETKIDKINIETKTIDELFKNHPSKIDFIKIDIEGHELEAIRGSVKILQRDQPILMIEIEKRHHESNFQDVIKEICELGYSCNFYDREKKLLCDIAHFSISKHQDLNNKENYYVHNFLFFPSNFSVDELNKTLKIALK